LNHASPADIPPAILLLSYPTLTLAVHGAASAMLIAAAVISLGVLVTSRRSIETDRLVTVTCVALACPLFGTLLSTLWHRELVLQILDAPSRFLICVPLLLVVRRLPGRLLAWSDLSFMLGAFSSLAVILLKPYDWGAGRLGSSFLNPIHFGDIALLLGVLSIVSLNWWRKDTRVVKVLKVAGLFAGLFASQLTGSRGGWVAIPVMVALIVYVRGRGRSGWRQAVLPVVVAAALVAVYVSSAAVRERAHAVSMDLIHYSQGQKDTSIGIRLQLYEAALSVIPSHAIFGLGANGFANSTQSLIDAGQLTPLAASFGRGELHSQLLAYTTNYGIVGGLAMLAIYLVPGMFFWKQLNSPERFRCRAAFMGLLFVAAFFVFGLTVETFDLKMTASFYATIVAILVGIAACPGNLVEQVQRAPR
jgi:O-antigen ligase